jgi:hypothetical protein
LQVFCTACESMIINVVDLAFFSPVPALVHVGSSSVALSPRLRATACSASRPLSRVARGASQFGKYIKWKVDH